MAEISYDPEVKILSIRIRKDKIVDSDIKKNCIIDYNKSGKITNIDILDIDLEKVLKKGKKK